MTTRTRDEIVRNLLAEQALMNRLVHRIEEIAYPTIDDNGQFALLQSVQLVDNRMVVPNLQVLVPFTQIFLHVPIFRKRTDIQTTASASYRTEHVLVTDSQPHRPMSAHAQPGNCTLCSNGISGKMTVYILHQLFRHKCLVFRFRHYRAIPVPRIPVGRGAYKNHPLPVRYLGQSRLDGYPFGSIIGTSVQQVHHRTLLALQSLVRTNGYHTDFLIHRCTVHPNTIHLCRLHTGYTQHQAEAPHYKLLHFLPYAKDYNPFFLASSQMASISSYESSFRLIPALMVCSSR